MAYPYPYMQAHPPPGYGVPGSTGYFTTQHLGGFYAPISNNPPFTTAQPQLLGNNGSGGQMFNGWPGAPQEQDKNKAKAEDKGKRAGSRERGREQNNKHEQHDRDGGHKTKARKLHKKPGRQSMPWEQVVESLNEDTNDEGDDDGDDGTYDHCDCSASDGCSASGSQTGTSSETDDNDDGGAHEVTIQPGGSAHIVVHLNRLDRSPNSTTFVVSARRMHAMARGWPHVCNQGTNDYDTTVTDEAAVLGMYWLLQVLHMGVEEQQYDYYHGSDAGSHVGNRLRPGMAPATTPRASPPAIPSELPARVLAHATLFAHQFGVLDSGGQVGQVGQGDEKSPPQMLQTNMGPNGRHPSPTVQVPMDRFRARAETWMRAVTNNPRCRRTLDSAVVKPADWPYVLYTARVLGDRHLFAVCLRTLLERWWLNDRGVFCDANGPARIDLLPESMRETVLRDLTSFKTARERSVEIIINGAMNTFSC